MTDEALIPATVYKGGVLQASGASIWAEDPRTDSGDSSTVTLVDSGSNQISFGWIPAMTTAPADVGAVWLDLFIAAWDTGGGATVPVAAQIIFSSGSVGSTAPFTDYSMEVDLTNDSGLTLRPVSVQLTDAAQIFTSVPMSDVIQRLTQTASGASGPRAIRVSTRASGITSTSGTRTVVIGAARLRIVGTVELPCNTTVDLDLSTATFSNPAGTPFGQYNAPVIMGYAGNNPQFWFPFELDPVKRYKVVVTYDPSSPYDGDGDPLTSDRWVILWASTPADPDNGTESLFDGFSNTLDVATFVIGPGIGYWDDPTDGVAAGSTRLLFQTSASGAVSAISIRKLCSTIPPPLRQQGRGDVFSSARRMGDSGSIQSSNKQTGYL